MDGGGQRLGQYEVIERLGAGGMAETFMALRSGPGGVEQTVCLKRILPAFQRDPEFVSLFLREARISARLQHQNIVRVLDVGVASGAYFMALELIEGTDLRRLLRRVHDSGHTMPSGIVAYLAYELGTALDYAHRVDVGGRIRGVVHRDISPSNVLLSNLGEVKLADFGIAKAGYATYVSNSEVVKGKVPYMAPEYATRGQCNAASDLFALAVTLYECIVGRRPFAGKNDIETMELLDQGDYPLLSSVAPHLPRPLTETVDRCLKRDPKARYATARQFLEALEAAPPPPTSPRILAALVEGQNLPIRASDPPPPGISDIPPTRKH